MTILFLARRFYPEIGGVEKHVLEISKRLRANGHQIIIICEAPHRDNRHPATNYHSGSSSDIHYINTNQPVKSIQNEIFNTDKINVLQFKFGGDRFFKKFEIWQKMLTVREIVNMVDIVHCHDVYFWYFPLRVLMPTKKNFVTFHGHETIFPPRRSAIVIRKISEVLSGGNICVGRYIEKWYGTKADFITYGGVDHSSGIKPIVKKANQLKKIVFLGRLDEDNGVNVYLAAFKILKQRGFSFQVEVLGDGKMRKKLENWGKVLGSVKNPLFFLKRADFVFSSSYLSMLESLSMKKKVFAVFENSLKEDYLKMSPFAKYVSISASAQDLADSIVKFKSKPESYEWARAQTWDKVTKLYLKLWEK